MSAQNGLVGVREVANYLVKYRRCVVGKLILFRHEEEFLSNLLFAGGRLKREAAKSQSAQDRYASHETTTTLNELHLIYGIASCWCIKPMLNSSEAQLHMLYEGRRFVLNGFWHL